MSTDATAELPAANGAGPEVPQDEALSILSGLRTEHRETRAARTKVFVIPGYEDAPTPLACRYGVIPWDEERKLEARFPGVLANDGTDPLEFYIAQLVTACREFGTIQPGDGPPDDRFRPLSKSKPVRWSSPLLAEGLDVPLEERSATAILQGVFTAALGEEDAPYAISDHHTDVLINWMHGGRKRQGATAEADEEFAKNS